jgi:NitT/TauT family transport system ATP-binding protein
MIDIEDLTFAYPGQTPLFEGFAWQAEDDESWAVIGPSGCGKSTLLYLLAGLKQPTSGLVRVGGQSVRRPRPQTGLILQDYGLLPWATVAENVRLGLRIRRLYGPDGRHAPLGDRIQTDEIDRRVEFWLGRLGIASVQDQYPAQISGGQRQRTAIARTLVMDPDLLLMDEPFSSLDAPTRENLERLTLELRAETGLVTVVVTHSIDEALILGQRLLVLQQPPHKQATILENPRAGQPRYRQHPTFQTLGSELRHLLGEETPHAQA